MRKRTQARECALQMLYQIDLTGGKLEEVFREIKPKNVVHFAAETHVDRSIQAAVPFIETNVMGTQNLIELCRKYKTGRFLHISTDEVYGESQRGRFLEDVSLLKPNNPYSATKGAAEFLVRAAMRTHKLPGIIIRPSNNYGPWQYPEKFIPVIILKAMNNQNIPVYGRGEQIREWLHVSDCARAIYLILNQGLVGEVYNIGSNYECRNIETAKYILRLLGKPESLIQFIKDRPGHDFRYSVSWLKMRKLGWKPETTFTQGMRDTVQWYSCHRGWLEKKLQFLQAYWKKVYSL